MVGALNGTRVAARSRTTWRRIEQAMAASALALCLIQSALGVVVTDNFSDLNDTANPVWTHLDGAAMSTGQTWSAATGQYRLTAPANGTHELFPGYSFVGSYTGPVFEDVRVSADFVDFTPSDPQGTIMGVAARLDGDNLPWANFADPSQGLEGYGYMYEANANEGRGEMVMSLIWAGAYKDIGSQKVTLDNSKDYRFVLEAIGPSLHGQVYELDGSGNIVKLVAEEFRDVVSEPVMDDFDFNAGTPDTAHVPYTSGYSGIWGIGHIFYRDADLTIDNFRTETAAAGDYNRDGTTDAADYVAWRKTFGNQGPVGNCSPSCNTDPIVFSNMIANGAYTPNSYTQHIDNADHAYWAANFGTTALGPGAGGGSAVPEPAAALLVLVGITCLVFSRR
jgi:hypothetical protein